jgi:hypothetical protein
MKKDEREMRVLEARLRKTKKESHSKRANCAYCGKECDLFYDEDVPCCDTCRGEQHDCEEE